MRWWQRSTHESAHKEHLAITPRLSPASAQVASTMQQTKQGLDVLWWYYRHYFLQARIEALHERQHPKVADEEGTHDDA